MKKVPAQTCGGDFFLAEHVQEPFPSELRPSAMIYDLVVFEDFLLDVDIAMLGILGVQSESCRRTPYLLRKCANRWYRPIPVSMVVTVTNW